LKASFVAGPTGPATADPDKTRTAIALPSNARRPTVASRRTRKTSCQTPARICPSEAAAPAGISRSGLTVHVLRPKYTAFAEVHPFVVGDGLPEEAIVAEEVVTYPARQKSSEDSRSEVSARRWTASVSLGVE
jgi:hypothetical protein